MPDVAWALLWCLGARILSTQGWLGNSALAYVGLIPVWLVLFCCWQVARVLKLKLKYEVQQKNR